MTVRKSDLESVLRRIADSDSIDWVALEQSESGQLGSLVDGLKLLSAVAREHARLYSDIEEPVGPDAVPQSWGGLRIAQEVGRGACGAVYRARDPRLERDVALKLLAHPALAVDPNRAIEEGRLLARVRHPNVVTVYGADCIGGRVGIWMELLEGRTVEEIVRNGGPLGSVQIVEIATQLLAGLDAVHAAGIVHRDITARNVIVQSDGRIVLMDLGAASSVVHDAAPAGTPLYIAPEVLSGQAATIRSDIYSVGVLLYHMATGGFPVEATTLDALREAHAKSARHTLRARRPDLPRPFIAAVERACEPQPDARFASARELREALQAVRRPGRLAASVGVAMLIMMLVVAVAVARRAQQHQAAAGPSAPDSVTRPGPAQDPLETVVVHSSAARQLYIESLHQGRKGDWLGAVGPAQKATAVDPSFASGWIWLAWTVRNATLGGSPVDQNDPARRAAEQRYAPYVHQAVELASSVSGWERDWILGSAAVFADDQKAAMELMAAVYSATHLDYARNNLLQIASEVRRKVRTPEEARDQLRALKTAFPAEIYQLPDCEWLDWLPEYLSWSSGDVEPAQARVDKALEHAATLHSAERPAVYFALALGRLRDARTLVGHNTYPGGGDMAHQLDVLVVDEATEDEDAMLATVMKIPVRGQFARPSRLIRAGLLDQAEELLQTSPPELPLRDSLFEIGRGQLLDRQGHVDEARPLLKSGMAGLQHSAFREYYDACSTLADGYRRQKRLASAVSVLEECTSTAPSYLEGSGHLFYGVWQWLVLKNELAQLYRANGRISEASAIEDALRRILVRADRDLVIVQRLMRTAPTGADAGQ